MRKLKVLIADEDIEANLNCYKILTNDKNLDVLSSSSKLDTLNKYHKFKPDILILNSDFIKQSYLYNTISYEPNENNLRALFYKLGLYNNNLGSNYLKYAILQFYNNPDLLSCLNDVFELISKEFNVSYSSIRPAIRNSLKSINDFREKNKNIGLLKLFENEDYITPKNFIRVITIYYLNQKNKK